MTEEPLGRLLASVQGALADIPNVSDTRTKDRLARAVAVQARCAEAVAIQSLAKAVDHLADAIKQEKS